jgi:tRNA pseudouridine55 synthase
LLPLCFGEGTKIAGSLLGARKAYRASCRLGITTTTADLEGDLVAWRPLPPLDAALIEQALAKLRGRITQVPPVYSAIKQDGEALYVKARRGDAVEVPPREVDVHRLELLSFAGDVLELEVECGSGTYIRSLAVDLGELLGCGAHLTALRRLWVDPFRAPDMVTLDQLQDAAQTGDAAMDALVLPVQAGLVDLPVVRLDAPQSVVMRYGQPVVLAPAPCLGNCAVYADDGGLLALGEVDDRGCLRIRRGFNLPVPIAFADDSVVAR